MLNKRIIIKTIVNFLTTFRCLFVLYLFNIFEKIPNITFIIIIIILFLTDFIDGFLARKYNVQTNYGATMDTIADKVLTISLILLIASKINNLYLVLLGEIIISLINICANILNKKTSSSFIGKIKMWVLSITIILSYLYYFKYINITLIQISILITIIFQIYVIYQYIINLKKQKSIIDKSNNKKLIYKLFSTKYYLECQNNKR